MFRGSRETNAWKRSTPGRHRQQPRLGSCTTFVDIRVRCYPALNGNGRAIPERGMQPTGIIIPEVLIERAVRVISSTTAALGHMR